MALESNFNLHCASVLSTPLRYILGYVTEAEKFGDSFCFHLFIPPKTLDEIKLQVKDTPWWLPVQGADWLHPVGPESSLEGIWDHPVVHVSYNDAQEYCR